MLITREFADFLYRWRDANSARYGKFKNSVGDVVDCETWTNGDWVMALVGEIGEAAEIITAVHSREPHFPTPVEVADLGAEFADVETYLDILAMKLNVDLVSAMNYHGDKFQPMPLWSASDYMTALVAHTGKIANWLKKILRGDMKMYTEKGGQTIRYWIEESFAAIQSYLLLLAAGSRIDLQAESIAKWNKVSEKIGFDLRIA